jgi:hypothetical protein
VQAIIKAALPVGKSSELLTREPLVSLSSLNVSKKGNLGLHKMTKSELAHSLNISRTMLYKLIARGMPWDSLEDAIRWRKKNLNPSRTKEYRAWLSQVLMSLGRR